MNQELSAGIGEPFSAEEASSREFVADWMAQASPLLVEIARYAALAHTFDLAFLRSLRGMDEKTDENSALLIAQLERIGLVEQEGPAQYTFDFRLRPVVLAQWQTADRLSYQQANVRATAFYQTRQPLSESDQMELLYHQLGANDPVGIERFATLFEQALAMRRLGLAEHLLQLATEQLAVLAPNTRTQLRYWQARFHLSAGKYGQSEELLRELTTQDLDQELRAQVLTTLANTLVVTHRWTEALNCYQEAKQSFLQLADYFNAARAFEAQGMTYIHLATSLGGLQEQSRLLFERTYQIWFYYLEHAPFLLYRWFSRRFHRLPNLYFGTDYQDWVIIRLLYEARACFEQAVQKLAQAPQDRNLPIAEVSADIQIRLADLYHRIERWSLAERKFKDLLRTEAVTTNEYRLATLQLSQGRAALVQAQPARARQYLQAAHTVFSQYGDRHTLATTTRLQGDTEVATNNLEIAVPFYIESIEVALATDDLLGATHSWAVLDRLRHQATLAPALQLRIDAIEQRLERRAYIARFPGNLLQRFRNIAIYGALPFTYFVISLVAIQLNLIGVVVEVLLRATTLYTGLLTDLLRGASIFMVAIFFTLWIYEFFYVFAGWLVVRRLSLAWLTQRQPQYVVTTPERIIVRTEEGDLQEMTWKEVKSFNTIDYKRWRTPIALFSSLILISEEITLVIEGIISHYKNLKLDIAKRL